MVCHTYTSFYTNKIQSYALLMNTQIIVPRVVDFGVVRREWIDECIKRFVCDVNETIHVILFFRGLTLSC